MFTSQPGLSARPLSPASLLLFLLLLLAMTQSAWAQVPSAPVLSGSLNGLTANLSWTTPTGSVTSYAVYYTVSGRYHDFRQVGGVLSPSISSYSDTSLFANLQYTYYVVATNAAGSSQSNFLNFTTLPAMPTSLSAIGGNAQATLSWTAPVRVGIYGDQYNIKRSTVSGGPYTTLNTPGSVKASTTKYTDSTAVNGTTHYYVVSSVGSGGEGANSGESSAMPNPSAFSSLSIAPTSVKSGTNAIGTITLRSPALTGGTSVALSSNSYAATVPTNVLIAAGASSATFPISTASVPTPTTPTIIATTGGATQSASLTITPSVVTNLFPIASVNGQVALTWTGVAGTVSYNVYRSTSFNSGNVKIGATSDTSYLDQGLTNGTYYYYYVTAVDASGLESGLGSGLAVAPKAQAFGFLNVGNGSVLSGDVTVNVSMASRAYGNDENQVTFYVDGVLCASGGDFQQSSGNAGANTYFILATDAFANGAHTLTVTDANGNTASANVSFNNVLYNVSIPSMFDNSGGDGLPTSAAITGTLTSVQPWTVSIVSVDSASTALRTFSGNSASINVSWDGKNAQGVEVDDDAYEVVISYGSGTQSAISPNGLPVIKSRKGITSKNRIGDCFILLDQDAFPSGYADMIAYLKAIKADLAPSKGNVWNKLSFFIHPSSETKMTPFEVQRIDSHFRTPLTVFYVDSHGGPSAADHGTGSQFMIGVHWWMSNTFSGASHSSMATLTKSANYGVSNPPALVFIDSCDSAGTDPSSPDLGFASDFDIGDGNSGFLGWAGFAVPYGFARAPYDDWTFWRLDLWTQFTNVNQTYDTAYTKLQNGYNAHGHNGYAQISHKYPDDIMVRSWISGSSF